MKHIAISTDKNYLLPAAVMLESLFKNSGKDFHIHVLVENVNYKGYNYLIDFINSRGAKGHLYEVDESIKSKLPPIIGHYSSASYHRLFLCSILPNEIDELLYLDVDLLILKDLTPLFGSSYQDYDLAAVEHIEGPTIIPWSEFKRFELSVYLGKLNLRQDEVYFNAGVLLINLKRWRMFEYEKSFISILVENSDMLSFDDQCVLNKICRTVNSLSWKFNSMVTQYNALRNDNFDEIHIAHAIGPHKPWNNSAHPLNEHYFYYLNLYFDVSKARLLLLNSIERIKIFFKQRKRIWFVKELMFLISYFFLPKTAVRWFYVYSKSY